MHDRHDSNPPVSNATTTIGIPKEMLSGQDRPHMVLSAEEKQALEALPHNCALLIATDNANRGARFLLDTDLTTVGRHPNADIFLDDVTVSRRHAEFHRQGDDFTINDTGSLNGTYVNSDRVNSVLLRDGFEVRIGKFCFIFYTSRFSG